MISAAIVAILVLVIIALVLLILLLRRGSQTLLAPFEAQIAALEKNARAYGTSAEGRDCH